MRTRTRICLVLILLVAGVAAIGRAGGWFERPELVPVSQEIHGDTGDALPISTFDGPMVRKRAAIAVRPVKGASEAWVTQELTAIAKRDGVGELTPATFAVFSPAMLEFLVPELTFLAPEGVAVSRVEAMMRDLQPADVAFYLVQPVLVHDITFAVVTTLGSPGAVARAAEEEGIVTDVLSHHRTDVQANGVTVSYLGAVLSDHSISSVRDALGRAAGVAAERVQVSANRPGPGVDMSKGVYLVDDEVQHRTHG